MTILGIDLGTTYSCVSYYNKSTSSIEIIRNPEGNLTTPSIVFFEGDTIIVGELAQQTLLKSASKDILSRIVYDSKRFIGKKTKDIDSHYLENTTNKLGLEIDVSSSYIRYNIRNDWYTPIDIAALIIQYLKGYAEDITGIQFDKVVITVPAYFNKDERECTKKAALQAGFKQVIRIINEPTAAALAYVYTNKAEMEMETKPEINLVIDIGGGTSDFSLIEMDYITDTYQVLSTYGESFLGGEDITELVLVYLWKQIEKKYPKMYSEIKKTKYRFEKVQGKLKSKAEQCKKDLSFSSQTMICIDGFYNDQDIQLMLTRSTFNYIVEPVYKRIREALDNILLDSENCEIDNVILIGGSTRIPYIVELVRKRLPSSRIKNTLDPDTTVGYGAGVQAYMLDSTNQDPIFDPTLLDIIPLTIGIELDGGIMGGIVSKNSILPTTKALEFRTAQHYLSKVEINIYQGERRFVKDNYYLGSFEVTELSEAMKGQVLVTIEISVDLDGIYTVKGYETKNRERTEKSVVLESCIESNLTEVKDMLEKAESYRFIDLVLSKKMEKKIELYDKFMELLEIFQDRRDVLLETHTETPNNSYTAFRFNTIFNKTWEIIVNFEKHSVQNLDETLKEFTKTFYEALMEISEYDLIEDTLSTQLVN